MQNLLLTKGRPSASVLGVSVQADGFDVELDEGERSQASGSADGYFASKHTSLAPKPYFVITDRRLIIFTRAGFTKKHLRAVAAWPLTAFTERLNTSQGSALGSYQHVLTLFTQDGETVSVGFKAANGCETFKAAIVNALGPILG